VAKAKKRKCFLAIFYPLAEANGNIAIKINVVIVCLQLNLKTIR
jgi:hypothetical protein